MSAAAPVVVRAPSWRVVRLHCSSATPPAVAWERLAVWCAIRELPGPDTAARLEWADYDPAADGGVRRVAVGCVAGPGVTAGGEFECVDTGGGWCAVAPATLHPQQFYDGWEAAGGWALAGLRHWTTAGQRFWPVVPAPAAP